MNLSHTWLSGTSLREREQAYPPSGDRGFFVLDAHRLQRGPYTGTGELLRQLIPTVQERWPELVQYHVVEILSIAPELQTVVPASRETLTSLAVPEERTRFYSRLRTLRLANGLVDLLKKLALPEYLGPLDVLYEQAHGCDPLDAEFLAVLMRRVDPALVRVTVSTGTEIMEPSLVEALERYAVKVEAPALAPVAGKPVTEMSSEERLVLARRYAESNGTSDVSEEIGAYNSLEEKQRQALHDEVADRLVATEEITWQLGAVPWHRERGSSEEKAIKALRAGLDYCIDMGYYLATIDFGDRGRPYVDWSEKHLTDIWAFTTKRTTSLAALGRTEEAEELYNEARASTDNMSIHLAAAYATSMLYTRHRVNRDHGIAREWIMKAIDIAGQISDPKKRAFHTVFNRNGLALIELQTGNPEEALRLVNSGLEHLDDELDHQEHLLHRSVLLYNKAQILGAMKRFDEAIADYTEVIELDPNYPEYHFDRGNLYSRMGLLDLALKDYERAMEISPPFPELYFNRANAYNRMGLRDKALADYDYLLEIDPEHADGYLNRATLFYEDGDLEAARRDVEAGLKIAADLAGLHCTLGLIEMAEGNNEQAEQHLTRALQEDPSLLEAHANLAVLLFEKEDVEAAIEQLNVGISHHPEAHVLYFNRAWALQAVGRFEQAVSDYTEALRLQTDDPAEVYFQRGACLLQLGRRDEGLLDWKQHLAFGESPYQEEIQGAMV
ncbi:MAG TPA: tetratricopeptide repeat protein [Bacilli bacterium]|nr:tetratricopeptide repeat protein [Bacilli bacterium]